ncbi:MAG: response regulator, partial [Thermodesulfobacteriota bacterium]
MSKKLKVLIVDDEPAVTRSVGRLLTLNGYEAVELNDPLKVEEYILYSDFSLAIIDVRMPGRGGLELLELLKKSKPDLPVLMLTGVTALETAVEATKLGAADYLTKPINNEGLLKAVGNHIKVDDALPDGLKEFIESNLEVAAEAAAAEPDKIVLSDEIVSTETIPEGLVEVNFENILP